MGANSCRRGKLVKADWVGVIGGGTMGAGIAHAFLVGGSSVTVVEADDVCAIATYERIRKLVLASGERGKLEEPSESVLARLTTGCALASVGGADLVIEAVPEDVNLKCGVLREVGKYIGEKSVVASNTSSISIGELAVAASRPERFIGLHFFNPVPASQLVEIVVGPMTNASVVELAGGVVNHLGKEGIVVQDSPGFASSRLGVLLGLEAVRMVEAGVASAEDIDKAMMFGYRHPIGPLHLTDLVGLDVRLGIARYLHRELGPRFEPPVLLVSKVAEGALGRKVGRGFFEYSG